MADKIVVLQAGVIEQVGSPLELYHTPHNLFVAGFIGSPRMNLLTGSEAKKHGATTIGIRPEHLSISPRKGEWEGVVGVSEHLGSDTFFHVNCPAFSEPLTVRASGDVQLAYGDKVYLTPDAANIHKFDNKGLRI
jgi:multiple sugar transport system ATP-binding protein